MWFLDHVFEGTKIQLERTKQVSRLKVGILGAGFIAKVHIGNLKNDERVEITGVVDLYLHKATTLAKEAGPQANAFNSLDDLFASEIDAVYVTTPNTLHVAPVLQCLGTYSQKSQWLLRCGRQNKSKMRPPNRQGFITSE
jgi:glutamyl-tRNA reductase